MKHHYHTPQGLGPADDLRLLSLSSASSVLKGVVGLLEDLGGLL